MSKPLKLALAVALAIVPACAGGARPAPDPGPPPMPRASSSAPAAATSSSPPPIASPVPASASETPPPPPPLTHEERRARCGLGRKRPATKPLDPAADDDGKNGPVTPAMIQQPVLAKRACFRGCLLDLRRRTPGAGGTIAVRFLVAPDGEPRDVQVERSTIADAAFQACVVDAFSVVAFPAPGRVVRIVYPMTFAAE